MGEAERVLTVAGQPGYVCAAVCQVLHRISDREIRRQVQSIQLPQQLGGLQQQPALPQELLTQALLSQPPLPPQALNLQAHHSPLVSDNLLLPQRRPGQPH